LSTRSEYISVYYSKTFLVTLVPNLSSLYRSYVYIMHRLHTQSNRRLVEVKYVNNFAGQPTKQNVCHMRGLPGMFLKFYGHFSYSLSVKLYIGKYVKLATVFLDSDPLCLSSSSAAPFSNYSFFVCSKTTNLYSRGIRSHDPLSPIFPGRDNTTRPRRQGIV
jgi:hypothetical protein